MCNCGNKRQSFNTPTTEPGRNDKISVTPKMEYTPIIYKYNNIVIARGIFSGRKYRFIPNVETLVEKRDSAALLGIAGMFLSA